MHAHHAAPALPLAWLICCLVAIAVLAGYTAAARRRHGWSRWRSIAFGSGVALLLAAFAPPLTAWAHADLRGHMAQHMLLGMYAPLLLALAAPATLLLGALPAAGAQRFARLLDSAAVRLLAHPLVALVLNIGGMALLYLTPLFAASRSEPWLHAFVHYHFVVAGYLYCWAIVGTEPAARRHGFALRLGTLLAGGAVHAWLAKFMYAHGFPRGTGFGWSEIEAAALWMYYGGDLAEIALASAFFARWYRDAGRRLHAAHAA